MIAIRLDGTIHINAKLSLTAETKYIYIKNDYEVVKSIEFDSAEDANAAMALVITELEGKAVYLDLDTLLATE